MRKRLSLLCRLFTYFRSDGRVNDEGDPGTGGHRRLAKRGDIRMSMERLTRKSVRTYCCAYQVAGRLWISNSKHLDCPAKVMSHLSWRRVCTGKSRKDDYESAVVNRILEADFKQYVSDVCLNYKLDKKKMIAMGVYVDDLLNAAATATGVDWFFAAIRSLLI